MQAALPLITMKNILQKTNRFFRNNCCLAVLDETRGRWMVDPEPKNIPYLKAENANGRHILVKPTPNIEPYYFLIDDLNIDLITRHHQFSSRIFKYGRMVVETSPGNYQVWIHSDRFLSLDEKRYWLKRLHNDPGADPNSRWGRCPGFRNRKEKHRTFSGRYPLANLVWIDWKHSATIPKIASSQCAEVTFSPQPRGGVCHKNNISRFHYEKGDDSATDFSYALALFRRGFTKAEISQRILAERHDWKHHATPVKVEKYLNRTLRKAWQIVFQT